MYLQEFQQLRVGDRVVANGNIDGADFYGEECVISEVEPDPDDNDYWTVCLQYDSGGGIHRRWWCFQSDCECLEFIGTSDWIASGVSKRLSTQKAKKSSGLSTFLNKHGG